MPSHNGKGGSWGDFRTVIQKHPAYMTRLIAILFILSSLTGSPVQAQSNEAPGPSHTQAPPAMAQADVTLAEALRDVTGREGARKGRKLLAWVRQRAEKAAKITHH